MMEAEKKGFYYGNPEWSNLGQGAPETGPLPGSPRRLHNIPLDHIAYEYGPVAGIRELREAVAALYNARYRRGLPSQYTAENVAICSGGRLGLTRVAAALGSVHLGHFLPDYTAYEELLDLFRAFVPIPILLSSEEGFRVNAENLYREIMGKGLGALLLSNPGNPTGQLIGGEGLNQLIYTAGKLQCALILDEFYSHYLYDSSASDQVSLSAAAHVEDVDKDGVIIVDGLTKNWRYPGLRLSWTVAPKEIINRLASAGSFIDGGTIQALQRSAISLLDPDQADSEALAIQKHFKRKRQKFLRRLPALNLVLKAEPQGAFYCFASLEKLPEPLRDGMAFFRACLEHKVICVPGEFFDVNPGRRRGHLPSRLKGYVRLSFGPTEKEIDSGLDRLSRMIAGSQ